MPDEEVENASQLLATAPCGILTIDDSGRITYLNRAATEITGWKPRDALGRTCREVFGTNQCFLLQSVKTRVPFHDRIVQIRRRDGTPLLVSVTTACNPEGGRIAGVESLREIGLARGACCNASVAADDEIIIGSGLAILAVLEQLPLIARSESTVLVQGEPGTGKELVARTIHRLGRRRDKPFLAVNCGAIPEQLVESELFGHRKGAFTDASSDHVGHFERAQGGTILLDEIGELSLSSQVKLLRVLQEREFIPLGATPVRADVRVMAATNRRLDEEVHAGRFRKDLFYRLDIVRLVLPPLRDRMEDLPALVDHFIARFNAQQSRHVAGVTPSAMRCLLGHDYQGNVRELQNAIEHAFVVCVADRIDEVDLPAHLRQEAPATEAPLDQAEAATIRAALSAHEGNRSRAAEHLGISRNTLWRKMTKYRIA